MVLTPYIRVPYTAVHTLVTYRYRVTNQPIPGFLTNTTTPPRAVWAYTVARAAASEDHSRAPRSSTDRLPDDWRRPRGRPRQSWLRTIESDLKPLNLGLHSALRQATDRPS